MSYNSYKKNKNGTLILRIKRILKRISISTSRNDFQLLRHYQSCLHDLNLDDYPQRVQLQVMYLLQGLTSTDEPKNK